MNFKTALSGISAFYLAIIIAVVNSRYLTHEFAPAEQLTEQPFYRLEVLFTHFQNPEGKIHNGRNCDVISKCDPLIHAYIDVHDPDATQQAYTGNLPGFYQKLTSESNKNTVIMNGKLIKDFCTPLETEKQKVNVRVIARDYDSFTGHDLIDQFDCRFSFNPTPPGQLEIENPWSTILYCIATHRPNQITLSYRWRAYPISASECGQKGK